MRGWALSFLAVAIVAALVGFGGIAAGAAALGKLLFIVFLILFVSTFFADLVRRSEPPPI